MGEIAAGRIGKAKGEEERESLEVQVDVRDIFEGMAEGRSEGGKERIRQINEDFRRFKERMEEIKRAQEARKREKAALEEQFRKSLENEQREEHRQ